MNSNVTAYHVTHYCRNKFLEKGFTELSESQNWALEKGNIYSNFRQKLLLYEKRIYDLRIPSRTWLHSFGHGFQNNCWTHWFALSETGSSLKAQISGFQPSVCDNLRGWFMAHLAGPGLDDCWKSGAFRGENTEIQNQFVPRVATVGEDT